MQRLFTSFAGGWPGAGLLLFRLLAGVALIVCGVLRLREGLPAVTTTLELIGTAAGLALIAGFFTPVAGTLAAIAKLLIAILQVSSGVGDPWSALAQATLGAGLAMIGPGAWSIDARRFGRKRIDLSNR